MFSFLNKYPYISVTSILLLIILTSKKNKFDINNFKFDAKGNYPDQTFGYPVGEYPTNGKNSRLVTIGGEGNNWGNTTGKALAFAKQSEIFLGRNVLTSQKRDWLLTASGNISDHSTTNKIAYGIDLACDVPTGDKLIAHLMQWFDNDSYRGGKWHNVVKDGYRYNIGWRVPGHFNHIHVGVKKVV
jgi:hypothetical protein